MCRKPIRLAILPLFGAALTHAADFRGVVTDPRGLPVQGAHVTLTCPRNSRTTGTDAAGRFVFPNALTEACDVHVAHPGFATVPRAVAPGERTVLMQLQLETMKQTLTVSEPAAQAGPTAGAFGSVTLAASDLRNLSNDPRDWIKFARLLAGSGDRPAQMYVDGMPATSLPPPEMIERIVVHTGEFSAEYAEGDYPHIDVITKSVDRHFRFNAGSNSLGMGGRDLLAAGPGAVSRSANGGLSGAVPGLPLAFSLRAAFAYNRTPTSVTAVLPESMSTLFDHARSGFSTGDLFSLTSHASYLMSEALRANFGYSETRTSGRNLGAGGLTLMDSGLDAASSYREGRISFNRTRGDVVYRGGFTLVRSESEQDARNRNAGINVLGAFSTGGPAILSSDSLHSGWTSKAVMESGLGQSWLAGVTIARSADSRNDIANPGGVYTFPGMNSYADALSGTGTAGSWTLMRGDGRLHFARLNASPFLQRRFIQFRRVVVTAGLRGDMQSHAGGLLSSRLSAAVEVRHFVVRLGAGYFAREIGNDVFVRAIQEDGNHLQPFLLRNVAIPAVASPDASRDGAVRARLGPDLTLPRQFMTKVSIDRSFERLTLGLQYTYTRERRLLGSLRFPYGNGWLDQIQSNRSGERREIHSQLSYAWRGQRVTSFYEWIRSRDNTDGPFSYPEHQGDLVSEWARSTAVAPHNFTTAGFFNPGRGFSLTVTETWHSSAPYNVTTGDDPGGLGLFNGRGGRPRNSGNGPAYNSLSAYASRKIALPGILGRTGHYAIAGVHGDNLLGNRNYLSVGSVAGSPLFGRPLAVMPGRSVRIWFNFN